MKNFITVEQAKERVHQLQNYIYLAETFEPVTQQDHIIKHYAYLGSLPKVVEEMKRMGYEVEVDDVREAIQKLGKHDLHKLIRAGYMKRTRPSRRK